MQEPGLGNASFPREIYDANCSTLFLSPLGSLTQILRPPSPRSSSTARAGAAQPRIASAPIPAANGHHRSPFDLLPSHGPTGTCGLTESAASRSFLLPFTRWWPNSGRNLGEPQCREDSRQKQQNNQLRVCRGANPQPPPSGNSAACLWLPQLSLAAPYLSPAAFC